MLNYLRSFVWPWQVAPLPSPVTVRCIRFPADGSKPHLLSLRTTTHGVSDGPDCFWGHVPDLREYWKTKRAWQWRDIETFRLENQQRSHCNGLYAVFYSFDEEALPQHRYFPRAVFGRERTFVGDVFVARLTGKGIGDDLGEDGWAAWIDVPSDILSLPVMKM